MIWILKWETFYHSDYGVMLNHFCKIRESLLFFFLSFLILGNAKPIDFLTSIVSPHNWKSKWNGIFVFVERKCKLNKKKLHNFHGGYAMQSTKVSRPFQIILLLFFSCSRSRSFSYFFAFAHHTTQHIKIITFTVFQRSNEMKRVHIMRRHTDRKSDAYTHMHRAHGHENGSQLTPH